MYAVALCSSVSKLPGFVYFLHSCCCCRPWSTWISVWYLFDMHSHRSFMVSTARTSQRLFLFPCLHFDGLPLIENRSILTMMIFGIIPNFCTLPSWKIPRDQLVRFLQDLHLLLVASIMSKISNLVRFYSEQYWWNSSPSLLDNSFEARIWIYFLWDQNSPHHFSKPSLSTLQHQEEAKRFLAQLKYIRRSWRKTHSMFALFLVMLALQDHMTNFLWSTRSINALLSTVITSSISAIIHIVWCCFLVYGLTIMHHHQRHCFTVHYHANHPPLLELVTVQSISACQKATFHSSSATVYWSFSPKGPSDWNVQQWTHPMATVDASTMVIIVCFFGRNLNFDIFENIILASLYCVRLFLA
jgi:hypothetical protein